MFISSSNIASSSTYKINIKRTLTTKLLSKQHFSVIIIKSVVRSVSGLVYLVWEVRGDESPKNKNLCYLWCIWNSQGQYCTATSPQTKCIYSSRVLAKWKQLMGHNFPAPAAEILSGPGAERERGNWECLQYGFYWYVILATWWKHHSFFGNLNEGKNVSEKCTLIHSLIYLCIGLIYLSSSQRYHIFLISDLLTNILYQKEDEVLCWTKIYTDKFIILNLSPSIRNICLTRGILYKNVRTHCETVTRWLARAMSWH